MSCRLFGAKPLLEPVQAYCKVKLWEQNSWHFKIQHFSAKNMNIKLSSVKWWPFHSGLNLFFVVVLLGWPPHGSMSQPSNHTGQNCLTLAHTFHTERYKMRHVNYFFWNDAPCSVRLPFICEKVARDPQGNLFTENMSPFSDRIHVALCQIEYQAQSMTDKIVPWVRSVN